MKLYIGLTDRNWFDHLAAKDPGPTSVVIKSRVQQLLPRVQHLLHQFDEYS